MSLLQDPKRELSIVRKVQKLSYQILVSLELDNFFPIDQGAYYEVKKQMPIGVVSKPVKTMLKEQKYVMKTADPEN